MEGTNKLRLIVGKKDQFKHRLMKNESSPMNKRNISANMNKKMDYTKSPSPIKGVKKLNVNVNVNLNGNNDNSLPQISTNLNPTPNHKLNNSYLTGSPNKLVPGKYRIVSKHNSNPLVTDPNLKERDQIQNSQISQNTSTPATSANVGNIHSGNFNLNNSLINNNSFNTNNLEETVKFKNTIQKLKSDLAFQKMEFTKIENELKQKEKLISELVLIDKNKVDSSINSSMISAYTSNNTKSKEYNLILALKKQNNELIYQLKSKEEEIEKMKKLGKITKMNELLVENRTLSEEFHKIKAHYDNSLMNSLLNDKQYQLLNNRILELGEKLIKKNNKNKFLKEEVKTLKEQILIGVSQENIEKIQIYSQRRAEENDIIRKLREENQQLKEIYNHEETLKTEIEILKQTIIDKEKEILNLRDEKEVLENKLTVTNQTNTINQMDIKEKYEKYSINEEENKLLNNENNDENEIDPPLTEDQFGELIYIITKNFEANNIDIVTIKEKTQQIFETINNENSPIQPIQEEKVSNEISENLMQLLQNRNPVNKSELILFCKYFLKNYLTNTVSMFSQSDLNSQFASLFNSMTNFAGDNSLLLTQNVKQTLTPYRTMLQNEFRKMDANNTGYITFYNLRKLIENLKLELDEDTMEYIIFLMKSFVDQDSFLRDLKYGNLVSLIAEEKEIPIEDTRRGSNSLTSSQILLPDKEFKARSEAILQKIAGFLYSQSVTTRKYFNQTFIIEEGERYYTGMYLKLFMKILQNEMNITLDVVDSLCLFNRLKNEFNVYNIEVIDLDKLVEEMEGFGIIEQEEIDVNVNVNIKEVEKEVKTENDENVVIVENHTNEENVSNAKFEELFQFKEANYENEIEREANQNMEQFVHPDIVYFRRENESIEAAKRMSKSIIDGVFMKTIYTHQNSQTSDFYKEQRKHEKEVESKEDARRMTYDFFNDALSKFKDVESGSEKKQSGEINYLEHETQEKIENDGVDENKEIEKKESIRSKQSKFSIKSEMKVVDGKEEVDGLIEANVNVEHEKEKEELNKEFEKKNTFQSQISQKSLKSLRSENKKNDHEEVEVIEVSANIAENNEEEIKNKMSIRSSNSKKSEKKANEEEIIENSKENVSSDVKNKINGEIEKKESIRSLKSQHSKKSEAKLYEQEEVEVIEVEVVQVQNENEKEEMIEKKESIKEVPSGQNGNESRRSKKEKKENNDNGEKIEVIDVVEVVDVVEIVDVEDNKTHETHGHGNEHFKNQEKGNEAGSGEPEGEAKKRDSRANGTTEEERIEVIDVVEVNQSEEIKFKSKESSNQEKEKEEDNKNAPHDNPGHKINSDSKKGEASIEI